MSAPRGVFAPLVCLVVAFAAIAAALPPELAAVAESWPPSSGLVLAEVMTGGGSASDEYVEIANSGVADADLIGCELIYVTASGTTVTRKASFDRALVLAPGQHLLVANASGIYGPLADATYSGGLAADGGAVALRRADGTVVDAVGWGTATNSYVETTVAPAPPSRSSLERLPGGPSGNTQDTNDNRADWFVQPNPIPQSLVSTPAPAPSAGPSATGAATTPTPPGAVSTFTETASPEPPASAASTSPPVGTPVPDPTLLPSASQSAEPTEAPTVAPTVAPTPIGAPSPSVSVTASIGTTPSLPLGSPSAMPSSKETASNLETIATVRAHAAGTRVHVIGVVTAGPGLVGADDLVVIQDSSAGIFVRIPNPSDAPAAGRAVEIEGTLAAPYGQVEIRDVAILVVVADFGVPAAVPAELGDVGEKTEGSLIAIRGVVESVTVEAGRLAIVLGDGTGSVRVLADPPAGLSRADVARGDILLATGVVGQRATATGRLDGYRLWLRRQADLVVQAPTGSQPPNPQPTGAPVHANLASALGIRGALVDVEAVVTATAGLLDIGSPTIVVDDGTAAVAVVLPTASDVPGVGMRVRVAGKVGTWQGGPTVRASTVRAEGELLAIGPRSVAGPLDASLEWQLVRVCGRIDRVTRAGARWRAELVVAGRQVVVLGEPAAAIALATSSVGRLAVVAGIVRRSTSDSSVFQLLPRTSLDFHLGPAPNAPGAVAAVRSASASGVGDPSGRSATTNVAIESLLAYLGQSVTIAGLVVDTSGETATVDDGTGEVRVGGSSAADALAMLEPGDAIEVTGFVRLDEQGLIIEADPASLVGLPGDSDTASTLGHDAADLTGGASMAPAAEPPTAASIRQFSPAIPLPDGFAVLAIVVSVSAAAVAIRAVSGGDSPSGGTPTTSSSLPSGRLVRFISRWPIPGREQRR